MVTIYPCVYHNIYTVLDLSRASFHLPDSSVVKLNPVLSRYLSLPGGFHCRSALQLLSFFDVERGVTLVILRRARGPSWWQARSPVPGVSWWPTSLLSAVVTYQRLLVVERSIPGQRCTELLMRRRSSLRWRLYNRQCGNVRLANWPLQSKGKKKRSLTGANSTLS